MIQELRIPLLSVLLDFREANFNRREHPLASITPFQMLPVNSIFQKHKKWAFCFCCIRLTNIPPIKGAMLFSYIIDQQDGQAYFYPSIRVTGGN